MKVGLFQAEKTAGAKACRPAVALASAFDREDRRRISDQRGGRKNGTQEFWALLEFGLYCKSHREAVEEISAGR